MTDVLLPEPIDRGFEYEVRLSVAIPLSWTKILKLAGEHHYDWKCREAAKQGVVNALHNQALFNEDREFRADHPEPSTFPVSWRNCDGMLKILEQAHLVVGHSRSSEIDDIKEWLHRTMKRITARHEEISDSRHELHQ